MGRNVVAVVSVIAVTLLGAAGLFVAQHQSKPSPTSFNGTADSSQPNAHIIRADSGSAVANGPVAPLTPNAQLNPISTDADTAYELVEVNLRCQIDRDASVNGAHVRSTTDELCKDLSLKPLSREEVFRAITYAAEHGHIRAQLDYPLYASRIFEDERNSLDPDLIREYKENTVNFLQSAGKAGEPEAYLRLSDIYKNGALAKKDPVIAYAYAEAYFRTASSGYKTSILNNATSGLDGAQLRRGKEIADQIVNDRSVSK